MQWSETGQGWVGWGGWVKWGRGWVQSVHDHARRRSMCGAGKEHVRSMYAARRETAYPSCLATIAGASSKLRTSSVIG